MDPIYLDHNATTPVDARVLDAMLPYLRERFGNPSSATHAFGWAAKEAVEESRKEVAALLGAAAREIVFTSGATEADNLALFGATAAAPAGRRHLVTQLTEHPAVYDPARELEKRGFEVTFLRPGRDGRVAAERVRAALTERTFLVSIMAANNEIGTTFPLTEIGSVCKEAGVLFHTDAAQAAGKIPLDVERMGIDLLSISAHKLYGPKGAGALYVRGRNPRVRLTAQQFGGGQERGLRPGTLNVPGIVGLGAACRVARESLPEEALRIGALRDRLEGEITQALDGVVTNGSIEHRLPGTCSLSFDGVHGTELLLQLPELALSSGSACSSGNDKPSRVLQAIGLSDERAFATLRFGLGRSTTEAEVDHAARRVTEVVEQLRAMRRGLSRSAGGAR